MAHIYPILSLIFLLVVIIFQSLNKSMRKAEYLDGPEPLILSEEPLAVSEKILTWICCLFNPIIAGAILYYGWRKRLPTKAKQANRIFWIAFLILIAFLIVLIFFGSRSITISPH